MQMRQPAKRQRLVRGMLAESLRAVCCQQLLHRKDDPTKRQMACEVMINDDAIANLIRADKAFQIPSAMITHRSAGNQLMDGVLEELVRAGTVDPDEALLKSVEKVSFGKMLDAFRGGTSEPVRRAGESGTGLRPDRSAIGGSIAPPTSAARASATGMPPLKDRS